MGAAIVAAILTRIYYEAKYGSKFVEKLLRNNDAAKFASKFVVI